MTDNEAKEYIRNHPEYYLKPAKKTGYICPVCGNGSGSDGTGITPKVKDGIRFKCFGECGTFGDVIDFIRAEYNLPDFPSALHKAMELYGITADTKPVKYKPRPTDDNKKDEPEPDFTEFLSEAHKHINETDYHRGISLETLNRYNVGYIEKWRTSEKAPYSPRLIIPINNHSYIARDTRADISDVAKGYIKMKGGKAATFNLDILKNAKQPIFIVEGEIDALSFIDIGADAVGIGSTSSVDRFLREITEITPTQPLIVALDNDDSGKKANEKLKAGLDKLGIKNTIDISVYGNVKDGNDALRQDRAAFTERVKKTIAEVNRKIKDETTDSPDAIELDGLSAFNRIASLKYEMEKSKTAQAIPTGFNSIDKIFDGGLYKGLYFIGAISSLGKTSLCMQIVDNIAKSGTPVIVFSLEMSAVELMAKSISRISYNKSVSLYGCTDYAKTTRGVLSGSKRYSEIERKLIDESIAEYETYADNIVFVEGVADFGTDVIKEKVNAYIKAHPDKPNPVVLIDYLQILAPADGNDRLTDKQSTDRNVSELKRLSRDLEISIIGISSFNRDNYNAPVNLASFKESGAIEYSSDVLIGLQYDGMDYALGETEKDREKRVRQLLRDVGQSAKDGKPVRIQVKILKNRNGSKGDADLDFYPMFNYFCNETVTKENNGSEPKDKETTEKKKPSLTRNELKQQMIETVVRLSDERGIASIDDVKDSLNINTKQFNERVKECGCFVIDGDSITTKEGLPF